MHIGSRLGNSHSNKPTPGSLINWGTDLAQGLLMLVPFWDRAGSTAFECVNNLKLAISDYPNNSKWDVTTQYGPALHFPGQVYDAELAITAAQATAMGLDNTSNMSIHMLINPTLLNTASIFLYNHGLNDEFLINTSGNLVYTFQGSGGYPSVTSNTAVNLAQWQSVTVTFQRAIPLVASLYINGQNVTGTIVPGGGSPVSNANSTLNMFSGNNSTAFEGWVALTGVWNRVLSPNEVLRLSTNPFQLWTPRHRYVTSSDQYTQSFSAVASTCSASISRLADKTITGTPSTATASVARIGHKNLSGTASTAAATVSRQILKQLAGAASTATGTITRSAHKALTASPATAAATIVRLCAKSLHATASTTAAVLIKTVSKQLSGTASTASATLSKILDKSLSAIASVCSAVVSAVKQIGAKPQPKRITYVPAFNRTLSVPASKWINNRVTTLRKYAADTIDFPISWQQFLVTTGSADSVVSATWNIPSGLTTVSTVLSSPLTTVTVQSGTVGETYQCSVTATTLMGRTREFPFAIEIVED